MTKQTRDWVLAGHGTATSFSEPVEGELREVKGAEDVLLLTELVEGPAWAAPVLLVHEAGGTTIGPMLGDIAGVVSTRGTLGAHIALLAKEYGCPCIVGASLSAAISEIDQVRLAVDGSIWAQMKG